MISVAFQKLGDLAAHGLISKALIKCCGTIVGPLWRATSSSLPQSLWFPTVSLTLRPRIGWHWYLGCFSFHIGIVLILMFSFCFIIKKWKPKTDPENNIIFENIATCFIYLFIWAISVAFWLIHSMHSIVCSRKKLFSPSLLSPSNKLYLVYYGVVTLSEAFNGGSSRNSSSKMKNRSHWSGLGI